MTIQAKKSFAMVDYNKCNPTECNPAKGRCVAAAACAHKVIKQIDGVFETPVIFTDLCMGCWDCIAACPLEAIQRKQVSS